MIYTLAPACRSCKGELETVLDLGSMYVNAFLKPGEPDPPQAPLTIAVCKRCMLVQLRHTVQADMLFRNFWYRSSVTATMRAALVDLVKSAGEQVPLRPGDVVCDIGSNDGTLLRCWPQTAVRIGFDPAENLAAEAREGGNIIVEDYFSSIKYFDFTQRKARIITCAACLYDIEEINRFLFGVMAVLDSEGVFVAQLSYLPAMLDTNDFACVCFPPDTLLLGDNKPISSYREGDRVFCGNGRLSTVKAIMTRQYSGEIARILPKYLPPMSPTCEHPVLIVKRDKLKFPGGQPRRVVADVSAEWTPATDVRKGDYLVVPRLKHGKAGQSIDLSGFPKSAVAAARSLNALPLNHETGWLLGLYVAEGSTSKHALCISLNEDESLTLARRAAEIARTHLGRRASIYSRRKYGTKSIEVKFTCSTLAAFLRQHCGKKANVKMIPDAIMMADSETKVGFLRGLFDGDGYIKGNKIHLHTSSRTLAVQAQLLLASLGAMVNFGYCDGGRTAVKKDGQIIKSGPSWQLRGTSPALATIFGYEYKRSRKGPSRICHVYDDRILVPVRDVQKYSYTGPVHNIETDDSTYLVSNATVHNCHEHLFYFSLTSLLPLMARNGLHVYDVEFNNVNGGSVRVFADHGIRKPSGRVQVALQAEHRSKLASLRAYDNFALRVQDDKQRVLHLLRKFKDEGPIYLLGASTKGQIVAQYYGFTKALIAGASDRDPRKHGLELCGNRIPIVSEEAAREQAQTMYVNIWPFASEVTAREADWLAAGGRLVFGQPKVYVVEKGG